MTHWALWECCLSRGAARRGFGGARRGFRAARPGFGGARRAFGAAALCAALTVGCAQAPRFVYEPRPARVSEAELVDVPQIEQHNHRACGAAALEMVLARWGVPAPQERISDAIDRGEPAGLAARDMKAFAEERGLRAFTVRGAPADLFRYIGRGIPLIVARRAQFSNGPGNHYMVAVGYTRDGEHVFVNDPDLGALRVKLADFLDSWSAAQRFLMVIVPGDPTATASPVTRNVGPGPGRPVQ